MVDRCICWLVGCFLRRGGINMNVVYWGNRSGRLRQEINWGKTLGNYLGSNNAAAAAATFGMANAMLRDALSGQQINWFNNNNNSGSKCHLRGGGRREGVRGQMRDLQFDGSCKSMCSFQWPRTAALSHDVRKKNRLNVNPEIPVRKGGAADTHTHMHTQHTTQQTHKDTKID